MYVTVTEKCFIRSTAKGLYMIAGGEVYNITKDILDIITKCDGTNSIRDIKKALPDFSIDDINEVIDFFIDENIMDFIQEKEFTLPIVNEKLPTSLTIELTYRCNEKCIFCISDAGKECYNTEEILNNELQEEDIDNILAQMQEVNADLLTITGGEPLLRKELLYYTLQRANKYNIKTALLTNGTLIDENTAKKLAYYKVSNIQISLDGSKKSTHDFLRDRTDSFEESITAIRNLKKYSINPTVSFVLNKVNYDEYKDMMELANKLEVQLRIAAIVPIGRGKSNLEYVLTNKQITEFIAFTHETESKRLSARLIPRERCSVTTSPVIDPLGDMYPCMHMKFKEFNLGNIRNTTVKNIWETSPIVGKLQDYTKDQNEDCKDCWNSYICDGCMGVAYSFYQTIYKKDPYRCVSNKNYSKLLFKYGDDETISQVSKLIKDGNRIL